MGLQKMVMSQRRQRRQSPAGAGAASGEASEQRRSLLQGQKVETFGMVLPSLAQMCFLQRSGFPVLLGRPSFAHWASWLASKCSEHMNGYVAMAKLAFFLLSHSQTDVV